MSIATSRARQAAAEAPDELDQLLDYDDAIEDFMKDIAATEPVQPQERTTNTKPLDEDQEVQVKHQRRPITKLDEDR